MNIDFEKNGYLVVRDFFDETTVKLMQQYWNLKWNFINFSEENRLSISHTRIKGTTLSKEDEDVAFTFNFFSDFLMESIELEYGQKVCSLLEADLHPSYTYTRIYEKDSNLFPHIDRPSCEISATCPVLISDNRSSQICISNFTTDDISTNEIKFTIEEIKKLGDYTEIHLFPGDVMFYDGCKRYHWRDPIKSDYLIQFFMHFVRVNGKYKDFVFDSRPYMGFPKEFRNKY